PPVGVGNSPEGVLTMSTIASNHRILLVDLSARELEQRSELRNTQAQLEAIQNTASTSGGLSPDQAHELADIKTELDSDNAVDPFYQAVVSAYTETPWAQLVGNATLLKEHRPYILKHGLMGSQFVGGKLGRHEQEIAGICGLLELDSLVDPTTP